MGDFGEIWELIFFKYKNFLVNILSVDSWKGKIVSL